MYCFFHFFKVISIDLMDLSFNLDSKKYERISWCLKEKKPLKFDFLLAWHQTGMKNKLFVDPFVIDTLIILEVVFLANVMIIMDEIIRNYDGLLCRIGKHIGLCFGPCLIAGMQYPTPTERRRSREKMEDSGRKIHLSSHAASDCPVTRFLLPGGHSATELLVGLGFSHLAEVPPLSK